MRLKKSFLAALGVSLMLILGACQSDENEEPENQEPDQEENGNEDGAESEDTEENDNEGSSDEDKVKDIFEGGE
ncbi:hypothetical protein [Oceanobacillus sp. CFH 90083]|uniref:hypothetical protein n=1 Tax=Oceanobacillus sp. CFH 90083 TaxID=2592336 RepID=UPI00128D04BB|nr:hypothetical protein [Oceanobacillus sp. CFH 90083]